MAQQAGNTKVGSVLASPPLMSVTRRRDHRSVLIGVLSVVVVLLFLAVVGLAGTTAFLWFSREGGGSMRPISLPDELGNFATVQVDDQLYDTGQSAATLQQTYHAAAAIREYKNGEGQNTNRMVVTAVRTRLPSPPPVLTAKGAGYRQRIEPAGSDVWCVIDGEESVTTRCLKSTGVLSVEVKQNSQGARLRSAELAALTRAAFDQID